VPSYCFACPDGHLHEVWLSIHHARSERPKVCPECGSKVELSIEKVTSYAVGDRGKHTAISDATDRVWHKDMAAYRRFAAKGIQPQRIDGCDRLEATAISVSEIESGGALRYSDERIAAGTEEAKAIMRQASA
jgi:hypothetical protein